MLHTCLESSCLPKSSPQKLRTLGTEQMVVSGDNRSLRHLVNGCDARNCSESLVRYLWTRDSSGKASIWQVSNRSRNCDISSMSAWGKTLRQPIRKQRFRNYASNQGTSVSRRSELVFTCMMIILYITIVICRVLESSSVAGWTFGTARYWSSLT